MLGRIFFGLALMFPACVASSQPFASSSTKGDEVLSGHYVGDAISKSGQSIPLVLDVTPSQNEYSGRITTAFGVFRVSGQLSSIASPLVLKLSGDNGQGTLTFSKTGDVLQGIYALADDSGTVTLKRSSHHTETAQSSDASLKVPILFLGVYHMANPELDAVPFVADDVLTPARQQQITALVSQLQQFHPTKVLVEAPPNAHEWQQRYEAYLHGSATLNSNEIEQLGFRVAQSAHLSSINGIDYQMYLNGLRPDEIRTNNSAALSAKVGSASRSLSQEEQTLRDMTISQYLARINSPESLARSKAQYMSMLLPDQQPDLYRGADQVANWYKRNLRIMENINRNVSPGDRVLVIIGTGHVPLLRQFAG